MQILCLYESMMDEHTDTETPSLFLFVFWLKDTRGVEWQKNPEDKQSDTEMIINAGGDETFLVK